MFSTCIGKALLKRHTATISALGGSVAEPNDMDFTHYVTIDGKARDKTTGFIKSFKTLLALAAGETTIPAPLPPLLTFTLPELSAVSSH
jgi:hypothetical protein